MSASGVAGINHPPKPNIVVPSPNLFRTLQGIAIVLWAVALFCAYVFWNVNLTRNVDFLTKWGIGFGAGVLIIPLIIAHIAKSIRRVGPDRLAATYILGFPLVELDAGPHLLPWPFIELVCEPREVITIRYPGDADAIFHGDDRVPLPVGEVRPMRMTTRSGKPDQNENDTLDSRMTLDIQAVVQYQMESVFNYFANIHSYAAAAKQLREVVETTLAEDVKDRTPNLIYAEMDKMNDKLMRMIQDRTQYWGVHILSARLVSPDMGHEVASALTSIPKATAEAEAVRRTAAGTRDKLTEEGKGAASAQLAARKADADGDKLLKDALGVDGDQILAARTAVDVAHEVDELVAVGAQSGLGDIIGALKGGQAALKSNGAKP